MGFLFRFILVSLIVYLLIRTFIRFFAKGNIYMQDHENQIKDEKKSKAVSKETGEYVDYEELDC